jgi:hypothetical protein
MLQLRGMRDEKNYYIISINIFKSNRRIFILNFSIPWDKSTGQLRNQQNCFMIPIHCDE